MARRKPPVANGALMHTRRWVDAARCLAALAILWLLALAPAPARAQATCWFTSLPDVLFAPYVSTVATDQDTSTTFQFDCDRGSVRANVYLSAGGGTVADRRMSQGSFTLRYNLYWDLAGGSIWGDGTGTTYTYPTNTRRRTPYPIYARLFAGQWVPGGDYTDTITITLEF